MNSCNPSNFNMIQVRPMTTLTSHKNSRVFLIVSMAWRSSFIIKTKNLYFTNTFFTRNNKKIHLIFTLQSSLFPFVFNNCASLHYSSYLLGEKGKYVVCNKHLLLCIRGYLKNVWTTKFVLCGT